MMNLADIPPGWATILSSAVGGVFIITVSVAGWAWSRIRGRQDELQAQITALQNREELHKARIESLEQRDRAAWIYIKRLVDSHLKHAPGVTLPDPPDGWLDD